jgi:ATP-dependent helicase HrpB
VKSLELPIDEVLPRIIAALARGNCAVLRAPTGAGKTTRVPPALLDAGLAGKGQILLLQPRRIAARAAAWRMADERGTPLGQEIGYQVRFERKASRQTRILALTEGLLVRMLQDDPLLEHVGLIVFDEFHERTLDADLALAIVRRLQTEVRPDLKLLVMSATLDPAPIARFLGGCPQIESVGRLHPVAIRYLQHDDRSPIHLPVTEGVRQVLSQTAGDVLAFLPGVGEIRRTAAELQSLATESNAVVMELYGDLPLERQQSVLSPGDRRKIVLATNVAETSLTIEGITAVVDSGLARINRVDPSLGLNRLDICRISQASADQRAGRAGRTAPGVCLRLWTEAAQRALAEHELPEIARVDLAGAILSLLCWGEADPASFPWFEPPPTEMLDRAIMLLRQLGAIDDRGLSELGRRMGRLPVEPRIARLLCEGQKLGHVRRITLVGALLSERDPFVRRAERGPRAGARHWSNSDVLDRVRSLEEFERSASRSDDIASLDSHTARFIFRARDQLVRECGDASRASTDEQKESPEVDADAAVRRALLAAFADRVARRRDLNSRRAVMVGGRGVRLHEQSAVHEAELFVCVDLEELGQAESLVRQASAIERDWLPAESLTTAVDVEYDAERKRIVAFRRTRYFDLVLDEAATNVPADFDAAPLLAQAAAAQLDQNFCQDEAGLQYLARVRSLARWMPELELPDFGDDPIRALLGELCRGCRSLDEVRRAKLTPAIQRLLTPRQIQAIAREAPERLPVPSGSQITLVYEAGAPPVLAVRIQEIFGMQETPRVAGGRIPVVMHLLAPNMRPQQITSDLKSFWGTTYAEVRKELRRRYPKHAWPEDPRTAAPQRRPGKKPRTQ